MSDHTNAIARLEPFVHGLGKAILREVADALEAAQAEIDWLKDINRDALSNLNELADLKNAEIARLAESQAEVAAKEEAIRILLARNKWLEACTAGASPVHVPETDFGNIEAVQPSDWETAMLDGLAAHCIDAPVGTPPREILAKIVATAIEIDRDPLVSDRVQPSQAGLSDAEILSAWNKHTLASDYDKYTLKEHVLRAGKEIIAAINDKGAAS